MPNDEEEQERLDLMHHLFLLSYDGELYRAPIPKTVGRTLDIGCGTGIVSRHDISFIALHRCLDSGNN